MVLSEQVSSMQQVVYGRERRQAERGGWEGKKENREGREGGRESIEGSWEEKRNKWRTHTFK